MRLEIKSDSTGVDLGTFVSALTSLQSVVTAADRCLSGGKREAKLKVNGMKRGSSVIDCSIEARGVTE